MKKFLLIGMLFLLSESFLMAQAPVAGFTTSAQEGCLGTCITFTDTTQENPISWYWEFGDGTSSTVQNPQHCYTTAGTFTVSLNTYTSSGTYNAIGSPILITESAVISLSVVNASDTSSCDGSIQATVSGGSAPYVYEWNNGVALQPSISQLCAGTYCLTVTDANGCVSNSCATISTSNAPNCNLQVTSTITNVSCGGGSDGAATLSTTGGAAPYSYTWSNGQSGTSQTNLKAGVHTVDIYDNQGCNASYTVVISEPVAITGNFTSTAPSSDTTCDGSATVAISGGSAPYSYVWNNQSATPTIQGLCAGVYCVTVYDGLGCTYNFCDSLSGSTNPNCNLQVSASTTNATCNGGADGSVQLVTTGGTAPYTYLWQNGVSGASISNLSSGVYVVEVKDNAGCSISYTVVINEATSMTALVTSTQPGLNMCDGSTNVTVTGGIPPYSYQWNNGVNTASLSALCPGVYCATVTDMNGCTVSVCDSLGGTTNPGCDLNASVSVTHASCNNLCDGSATISVSGGVAPYIYNWDSLASSQTTMTASNLCADYYTALITDNNGCTVTVSAYVGSDCDSVWPGDANNNKVANVMDILPIGMGFGTNGSTRNVPGNSWLAHQSANWNAVFSSGQNYKHADCNGDGTIDAQDVDAILMNYGMTHQKTGWQNGSVVGSPDLFFTLLSDTLYTAATVEVAISFGTNSLQAAGVYGLAFSIKYDPTLIDSGSFSANFSNSWLANGNNSINLTHEDHGSGQFDVGLTRTDHQDISGFGEILKLTFVTIDNISGRGLNEQAPFPLTIEGVNLIASDGANQDYNVQPLTDTIFIIQGGVTGKLKIQRDKNIKMYPVPARDKLVLQGNFDTTTKIELVNVVGQVLLTQIISGENYSTLNLENIPVGLYFVRISDLNGASVKMINVAR